MHRHVLSFCGFLVGAVIGLGAIVAAAIAADNDIEVLEIVRGWGIVHDKRGDAACFAITEYAGGITLSFGRQGPDGRWVTRVANPKWASITPNEEYEIEWTFDGRRIWQGIGIGLKAGFESDDVKDAFIEDLGRSLNVRLSFRARELGHLNLDGATAAIGAVTSCFEERVAPSVSKDPFAPDDAFAVSSASVSDDPILGRCRMGYCSWGKVVEKEVVEATANATLYRVLMLGGESGEYKSVEDYPDYYSSSVVVRWNDEPHEVFFFCSNVLPAVIMNGQADVLDFASIPGVLESTANSYVSICHGGGAGDWASPWFVAFYGYDKPLLDSVDIHSPGDLFDIVKTAAAAKKGEAPPFWIGTWTDGTANCEAQPGSVDIPPGPYGPLVVRERTLVDVELFCAIEAAERRDRASGRPHGPTEYELRQRRQHGARHDGRFKAGGRYRDDTHREHLFRLSLRHGGAPESVLTRVGTRLDPVGDDGGERDG